MSSSSIRISVVLMVLFAGFAIFSSRGSAAADAKQIPAPVTNAQLAKSPGQETVVFAGGCFWGVQAVFQHVKGVTNATSGYSGGEAKTAEYEIVSTGMTGHAESVKVTFDPSQVTFGELLRVFFSVAHDPTELNRQGPDDGTQYRSVVFYSNDEQARITHAYVKQLDQAKLFSKPIVTQVVPLKAFYPAEAYHQNYATLHPESPYIRYNDAPKVVHLKQQFPQIYAEYTAPK